MEVAGPIEQADSDDRDTEVRGGLEVIAGENAETTGVLRKCGSDAVLRGEVGDRCGTIIRLALKPRLAMQVGAQVIAGATYPVDVAGIGGKFGQPLARHLAEKSHRVVADAIPQLRVDRAEDIARLRVPGPPQVVGELLERLELGGHDGADSESANRLHGGHASGCR